jgi:serine/threonine-protein kinase
VTGSNPFDRPGTFSAQRWREIERLLDRALDLPAESVGEFLDRECSGDRELRAEIEALLRADAVSAGFLDQPVVELTRESISERTSEPQEADPVSLAGERIGPWRIEGEVGRGGMGAVYRATRADGHFEQTVALKLIKRGLDTDEVLARFRQERQILARLEHPGIARLVDGGATADGRPYVAMEFVEGEPLTEYSRARGLDLRARLELFDQICAAVAYAHRSLVIHRDLKPGNILVTREGKAKLLDFGIAKLLGPGGPGGETLTMGPRMTPHYAAPEQVRGDPPTTATDVYALGVILYELLTGVKPHGGKGSLAQLERAILEEDPEPPSGARVRSGAGGAAGPSAAELRGDLDNIVLVALRKEPERRYSSAEALRADLERYRSGQTVTATRPTLRYRSGKYVARHRVGVTAAAVALVSLVAGLIGTAWQARVAGRERDRALSEANRARAINDFVLNELLEAPMPERALGRALTVSEVLDNASRSVQHAFASQPGTEAAVRMTLARTYQALGNYPASRRHAEAARDLLERAGGAASDTLGVGAFLGELAIDEGDYAGAHARLEATLRRAETVLGPSHETTLRTRIALGRVLSLQGEPARAQEELRRALGALGDHAGARWRLEVRVRWLLADALTSQHRPREAETQCLEALRIQQQHLGNDHPEVAETLSRYAAALGSDLRWAQAEGVMRRVVDMRVRLFGENHPATADAIAGLALQVSRQLRHDEARALDQRALAIYRATLGDEHPRTLRAIRNVAVEDAHTGRLAEAETLFREVYAVDRRTLGELHPETVDALQVLQGLNADQGRSEVALDYGRRVIRSYEAIAAHEDAEASVLDDYANYLLDHAPIELRNPRRALELAKRAVRATGRKNHYMLRTLGLAQGRLGMPDEAIASLREALSLPAATASWTTEEALFDLMESHSTPAETEAFLQGFLDRQRADRGPDDLFLSKTLRLLGKHERGQHRLEPAERWARGALVQLRKSQPESFWEVGRAELELGDLLVDERRYAEAETLLVAGFRTLEADLETDLATVGRARDRIVHLYVAWGQADKARAWRTRRLRPSPGT